MKPRTRNLGLTAILGLGLALRLIRIARRPLWYDEAFSILLARQPLAAIVSGTAADTMPPLYYFLLHGWSQLGDGLGYLRSLNVLFGLGIIFLVYLWGRRLFGDREALVASLLAATSPFLIYHAQELRMYTLLALTLLGYSYACSQLFSPHTGRTQDHRWLWLLLVGSAVLALYTHNLAAFTLIVPNVYLAAKRRWRRLGKLLTAQALAGLLALPWLLILPGQIAKIQRAFWTPQPGIVEILQALIVIHYNLPVPDRFLAVAVGGTVLTLVLLLYTLIRRPELRPRSGLLILFAIVPAGGLLAASYLMRPLFVPRAIILSSAAYYLILAGAIVRPALPGSGGVLLVAVLLPQALFLPFQYTYESFPRSPFDRAGRILEARVEEDEVVLHGNKLSYFPMAIHSPSLPAEFLPDEPGSHNDTLAAETQRAMGVFPEPSIEEALEGHSGIWFVVFERAIEEYEAMGMQPHPAVTRISKEFRMVERLEVGDLILYEFRR